MPTNKGKHYMRDYRKRKGKYKKYHGNDTEKKKRSQRNAARAIINKERKKAGKSKLRTNQHVDHKRSGKKSLSNKRSNLRVVSRTTNLKRKKK